MIWLLSTLALLAALRLTELGVSRRNWLRHRHKADCPPEPMFIAMLALHTGFFVLLPLERYFFGGGFNGPVSIALSALVLLTFALRGWTLAAIGSSWNVRVVGGPEYPIVASGPYRFIRHPNYLVVILELLLIPLVFWLWRSALLLSVLNLWVLRHRILHEETLLAQNPTWLASMAGKPRFLPEWGSWRDR